MFSNNGNKKYFAIKSDKYYNKEEPLENTDFQELYSKDNYNLIKIKDINWRYFNRFENSIYKNSEVLCIAEKNNSNVLYDLNSLIDSNWNEFITFFDCDKKNEDSISIWIGENSEELIYNYINWKFELQPS